MEEGLREGGGVCRGLTRRGRLIPLCDFDFVLDSIVSRIVTRRSLCIHTLPPLSLQSRGERCGTNRHVGIEIGRQRAWNSLPWRFPLAEPPLLQASKNTADGPRLLTTREPCWPRSSTCTSASTSRKSRSVSLLSVRRATNISYPRRMGQADPQVTRSKWSSSERDPFLNPRRDSPPRT